MKKDLIVGEWQFECNWPVKYHRKCYQYKVWHCGNGYSLERSVSLGKMMGLELSSVLDTAKHASRIPVACISSCNTSSCKHIMLQTMMIMDLTSGTEKIFYYKVYDANVVSSHQ